MDWILKWDSPIHGASTLKSYTMHSRITIEALDWRHFYIAYTVTLLLGIWVKLIATAFYINMTSYQCFDSDATVRWGHRVIYFVTLGKD